MRTKSVQALVASLSLLALPIALPVHAAENADHTVTCKDGTREHIGKDACSHHGGVEKGGASASAKSDEHGQSGESHGKSQGKEKH
jgi:hypothetical protein